MYLSKKILPIALFLYYGLSAAEVTIQPSPKSHFAVIYRTYTLPGREDDYQKAWQIVAQYFVENRGAIGSCLHQASDGMWVAYSRWPDKKTRDASWPGLDAPSEELPPRVREAILTLRDCADMEKRLPDICMDVVNDMLINR